jgi:hypothetical protein
MHNLRRRRVVGIFLALTGLLSACASTSLQKVQHTPEFRPARIHKVLVVAITKTPPVRSRWENEFVLQWRKLGVDAIASSEVLPAGVALDKAELALIANARGFDSVLVMRLLKREKITPEIAHPRNERVPPLAADSPNLTQYVQAVVASPEYPIDFEVAVVSTNLYDAATEKLVWSSISQTLITGDAPRHARPFVKIILKNIYQSQGS